MLMSDICNKVLTELRFGSGADVQIHLQEGVYQNVSRLYRTLMLKHVWRDYHAINTFTTDINGQIVGSLAGILTRYSNIIAVYQENDTQPLPWAPVMSNPTRFRRPALVANGGATVFTIYPQKIQNIVVISRFYEEDDFLDTEDVPFYADVLITGAAFQLAVKAGINKELTQSLGAEHKALVDAYRMNELQDIYQTSPARGGIPTEWYSTDQ